ncbi:hypothetical protein ACFYTQ_00045 [Nocardia sp. NPDC004068]|uniref:hypothetical protein n=1 Tax=Nocardia sp. NPDC004068 TaxID=3364303 RepID=UPI0036866605
MRRSAWERNTGAGAVALWAAAVWGALAAVLVTPFAAALVASVFRFPIPFGGYARGGGEAVNAGLAAVFYLVVGVGPVLAVLGAVAGVVVTRQRGGRAVGRSVAAGCGLALVAALLLAMLTGSW